MTDNDRKLTKIYLYGALRKHCDNLPFVEMYAPSVRMAVQALASRFGQEVKTIIAQNNWQIYSKRYKGKASGKYSIGDDSIDKKINADALHFYPVVEGSGRAGQIILGVVLIVVGYVITGLSYGWAAPVGQSLIGAGVGMILQGLFAPSPPKERERPENRPSFIFNQAVNTIEQGGPVPLVYGRFKTGSTVVSAGIDAERLSTYTGGGGGGNPYPDSDYWDRHGVVYDPV